jgi:hypothetical protein
MLRICKSIGNARCVEKVVIIRKSRKQNRTWHESNLFVIIIKFQQNLWQHNFENISCTLSLFKPPNETISKSMAQQGDISSIYTCWTEQCDQSGVLYLHWQCDEQLATRFTVNCTCHSFSWLACETVILVVPFAEHVTTVIWLYFIYHVNLVWV